MTNEPFTGTDRQRADVDVVSEPGHAEPVTRGGLRSDDLVDDTYLLVLRHDHPLSEHSVVSVGQLADEPLLDPDVQGSATGDVIDHAARAAGISPATLRGQTTTTASSPWCPQASAWRHSPASRWRSCPPTSRHDR